MIQIIDGKVTGNITPGNYAAFKPWRHESGACRWVIDNDYPTHTIDGYNVRQSTQVEIEADPLYIAWKAEQDADTAQTAAKTLFQSAPNWIKTNTADQVEAYVEENVSDVASAKAVLKEFGRVLIMFRDYQKIQ